MGCTVHVLGLLLALALVEGLGGPVVLGQCAASVSISSKSKGKNETLNFYRYCCKVWRSNHAEQYLLDAATSSDGRKHLRLDRHARPESHRADA